MIDFTEVMKQKLKSTLYTSETEDFTKEFDNLIHLPISCYIPWDIVCKINKLVTSLKYSDKISYKKKEIEKYLKPFGFRKFGTGTNRMVFQFVEDHSFLIKVAIDKVGVQNNFDEYVNMNLLKPFMPKTFDVTPCGTMSMVERVQPITSLQEAISIGKDVFDIIVYHILGKYVAADIGTKFYMNWGVRAGFGPVILDLTDLFPLDGSKLHCSQIDPNGNKCNGEIDYDSGFNNLVCNKCRHIYEARELAKKVEYNNSSIVTKGSNIMAVELIIDGQVVKRTNQTTECILPRAPRRRRPNIYTGHNNERKGAVLVIGDVEQSGNRIVDKTKNKDIEPVKNIRTGAVLIIDNNEYNSENIETPDNSAEEASTDVEIEILQETNDCVVNDVNECDPAHQEAESDEDFTTCNDYDIDNQEKDINELSEQEQIELIKKDPWVIEDISNPSEVVQLATIEREPYCIISIFDPPEKVQLAAIEKNPSLIDSIVYPTEKVQLTVVEKDPSLIEYIKNPSEQVQLAAVMGCGSTIEYIKNPSEQVQLAAVNRNASNIRYIKNPSEQVQLAAVEKKPYSIKYIGNPTEKVLDYARSQGYHHKNEKSGINNNQDENILNDISENIEVLDSTTDETSTSVEVEILPEVNEYDSVNQEEDQIDGESIVNNDSGMVDHVADTSDENDSKSDLKTAQTMFESISPAEREGFLKSAAELGYACKNVYDGGNNHV